MRVIETLPGATITNSPLPTSEGLARVQPGAPRALSSECALNTGNDAAGCGGGRRGLEINRLLPKLAVGIL